MEDPDDAGGRHPQAAGSCKKPLLELIEERRIDLSFIITHRMRLDDAPEGYGIFCEKEDGCIKIMLQP